jgi:formylglycine-generating enzyme required for sulfatase activity
MSAVTLRLIRVFVSSPGDCLAERAVVDEVVERINKTESERSGLLLRTFTWEHDVVPQIGPAAQAVVDAQTPACDIYVGMLSARFGGDDTRGSGTEKEFRDAVARFGDTGAPWILFYFNDEPRFDRKPEAARELEKVFAFREELERKGIVGSYAGVRGSGTSLFERFDLHLRWLLQRPELTRPTTGVAAPPAVVRRAGERPQIPIAYTASLQSKCAGVDLLGLEPKHGAAARLQSVYVSLTTTAPPSDPTGSGKRKPRKPRRDVDMQGPERERPTLLLDRLATESLYVSGAPGSGKSTFCRWVTWLACEGRMPANQVVAPPENYNETFPTVFENSLPLFVRLREFWHALPSRPGSAQLTRNDFERALAKWVEETCEGITAADVLAHINAGSALMVFDGVDEVPITDSTGSAQWFPRALLLAGLANGCATWVAQGNRILVTSRPYGVTSRDVGALGLAEAPLLDLDNPLRELLIARWFRQLRPGEEGERYAADLSAHLGEHDWLLPLAANPLLLTGMCIVFDEGRRLPQDKHDLYLRIVNTVLNARYRHDTKERDNARYRLQAIAYGMHTGHGLGESRVTPHAEASHAEVDRILRDYLDKSASKEEGNAAAVTVREELLSQSGLFLGRGDGTAGFYHLSFQEFLAGQRLADVEDDLLPVFLERAETPEWHNTLSLLFASLTREKAARLLTRLVERFDGHGLRIQELAADCLNILIARGARLDDATEQICRNAFLRTMTSTAPAIIRCRVGTTLGRLGDPRFHDESRWCLPVDPMTGFVEVPAGEFVMGEEPERHLLLPSFWIARYPVTVAQYAVFAAASKREESETRGSTGTARGPNHPVALVTWHDALAYCHWVDARLRQSPATPAPLLALLRDGRQVTLPSEAEWERAARGSSGRAFPWGNDFEADRSNTREAGIGTTSPVGVFPLGATSAAEGRVEDLSGNVWEWTRSQHQPYPYQPDDGREGMPEGNDVNLVERGGAYFYASEFARAAFRLGGHPDYRLHEIGFRLAVSRSRS